MCIQRHDNVYMYTSIIKDDKISVDKYTKKEEANIDI